MYARGQGVSRDFIQAQMWYTLAVGNGAWNIAEARNNLAKHMTPPRLPRRKGWRESGSRRGNERMGGCPSNAIILSRNLKLWISIWVPRHIPRWPDIEGLAGLPDTKSQCGNSM
jgi:hypothetical protein